jgi:outer membrane cobalamin receptor
MKRTPHGLAEKERIERKKIIKKKRKRSKGLNSKRRKKRKMRRERKINVSNAARRNQGHFGQNSLGAQVKYMGVRTAKEEKKKEKKKRKIKGLGLLTC